MTAEPTLFGEEAGIVAGPAAPARLVEVAIDAAGGGGNRTYTYHLPERLADVQPGEAVLVEYGRRQALAVVLGETTVQPDFATKPVAERVRADGPLLPPLALALARWIAATYLAPPALVLRAMLPPGFLEKLELVAEALPADPEEQASEGPSPPPDALLEQLANGPRPVRDLAAPDGRGALIRRLRALEREGRLSLEWTLLGAAGGPRFERWVRLSPVGRDVVRSAETPTEMVNASARGLGPRQRMLLDELAGADPVIGLSAPDLAHRHGGSALPGLVRRGLVEVEVRRRDRLALARRARGTRGARPTGSALLPEQENGR